MHHESVGGLKPQATQNLNFAEIAELDMPYYCSHNPHPGKGNERFVWKRHHLDDRLDDNFGSQLIRKSVDLENSLRVFIVGRSRAATCLHCLRLIGHVSPQTTHEDVARSAAPSLSRASLSGWWILFPRINAIGTDATHLLALESSRPGTTMKIPAT